MQNDFSNQGIPPVQYHAEEQVQQSGMAGNVQQARSQWDPSTAQKYQGEIPNEDMDENASTEPPPGSALPPFIDAPVPGYENIGFGKEVPVGLPPAYGFKIGEDTTIDTSKLSSVTEDDAKEALLEYVSQHCCYGKGAAEDMDVEKIEYSSALHYTLETFTEARSTKWCCVPYSGGFVDGPNMGPAPGPWDIPCGFSTLFQDEVKILEVPHTASIRPCHLCSESGFVRCWRCRGRGMIRCSFCNGSGRREEMLNGEVQMVACITCEGVGRRCCYTCNGIGCVRCNECEGFCLMKQYIQLTVTFKSRLTDYIDESTDLPDHLIQDATGDVLLEQILPRVGPISNFVKEEVNRKSHVIVNEHAISWPTERIIQQRQRLTSVPVYECEFEYKDKDGRFWVYGKQRLVYTEDYPQTCFFCTIL